MIYLVTGGTGSLGTAITRRLLTDGHHVRAYARNEHKHESLERDTPQDQRSRLSCLVGDVRDKERLSRAADGAHRIIHAAALKIIPIAEYNPIEAVRTNIDGTVNMIEVAIDRKIGKAILVSTDKACAPANLYGATKMVAERLWLHANAYCPSEPKFAGVRYGNVAGSAGSVWHTFHRQKNNGILTVTDSDMTRFHSRMDQAVDLVLRAAEEASPGELWIPKLPSYRVGDLAAALAPRKPVKIIGQRPGEKIHESMISEHESPYARDAGTHFVLTPSRVQQSGGWSYTSAINPAILSLEQIQEEAKCLSL